MSKAGRVVAATVSALACTACAAGSLTSVHVENDAFSLQRNRNRLYTSGIRVSGLSAPGDACELARDVADMIPVVFAERSTQVGWVAGQEIYTPANLFLRDPNPDGRPYGGWLYGGVIVSRAVRAEGGPAGDHADIFEADFGFTGKPSLAEQTTEAFHTLVNSNRGRGWDHQIRTEPGVILQYEHRRRLLAGESPIWGTWDVIGGGSLAVGNILDQVALSAMVRWGGELPRDFGPGSTRSTTVRVPGEAEGRGDPHWHLFAGIEGRGVARNIFLDGNTFSDSRSVPSKAFVSEARVGIAADWGAFRLAIQAVRRSREFDGQDDAQEYGAVTIAWHSEF